MICQRCGNDLSENSSICPACGSATGNAGKSAEPSTSYEQFPQHEFEARARPPDQRGDPRFAPPSPPPSIQQISSGSIPAQGIPYYHQRQSNYNASFANNSASSFKRDTALVAEFILSLFGLFGVGWLIGGSTAIGVILLVCSVFIYWPLMIGAVILTRGFGLLCLGPLAMGAIILNMLLLSVALRRKTARFTVAPPPPERNRPSF